MLAALVLASWWSQAEPAPPPAWAVPSPSQGPAPAAPAGPPPPGALRPNALTIQVRFAYRLGSEGETLGPAAGVSVGGTFERTYLARPSGLELGAALDFFHDRFARGVVGSAMVDPGQEETFDGERSLSHTSFALGQTVAWRTSKLRLFAGLAGGATISYFSSPELALRPGSKDAVQPLLRGLVGAGVPVSTAVSIVVRVDYTRLFTRPTFTTNDGTTYSMLGDLFHAGAGLEARF